MEIRHTWNNVNHIYKLNLENTGIGPAIIREVNIHYNNKIFQDFGDMAIEVSRSNKLEDEGSYWDKSDVLPQAVLPQQREKQLLFIGDEKYFETFVEELDSIEVKITYESLYGEAWEITYPKIRHRRID